MSTKSSQKHVLVFNQSVYVNYFWHLAKKLGATCIDVHQRLNFTLRLAANFPRGNRFVAVEIILDWSHKGTCWLLREMDIEPGDDILDPSDEFLPFKSIRLANERDLNNPSDEVYRIRSASDLAALLVAYDWLLHEYGWSSLFGH